MGSGIFQQRVKDSLGIPMGVRFGSLAAFAIKALLKVTPTNHSKALWNNEVLNGCSKISVVLKTKE
jgi:hypothetical protein